MTMLKNGIKLVNKLEDMEAIRYGTSLHNFGGQMHRQALELTD